jgi:PAS domain S-box-containing protein
VKVLQSISWRGLPLIIGPFALVLAIGALALVATRSFVSASNDVEQSHRGIGSLARVLEDIQNAETGQRGFIITGDESYLDPYTSALARLPFDLAAVHDSISANPGQMQRLTDLEKSVNERLVTLEAGIADRRANGFDATREFMLNGVGKTEMDAVRTNIEAMRTEEERLFAQRSDDRDTTARNELITLGFLIAVELGLLGTIYVLLRRYNSERRRREGQAIALAEARYRAVGDAIPFGVWSTGPDGRVNYVSPSFLEMLGMSFEDYRREGWKRIFRGDDLDEMTNTWKRALANHEPFDYLRPMTGADGVVRTVLGKSVPITGPDGDLRGYAGINLDVTDARRAERALGVSELRYRTLAESMPAMIATASGAGGIEYHNRLWTDFTGLSAGELEGSGWHTVVHPDDLEHILDTWAAALEAPYEFEFDFRLRRQDGVYCWYHDVTTPVLDADGSVALWISVDIDIDQRKIAEDAMVAASVAKDDFLGMVSHELRTPLTIILGNARAMSRMAAMTPDERASCIDDITSESERLQRLIENMLMLSRVERRQELEVEPVLLQRELAQLVQTHTGNRPFTVHVEADLDPVAADPGYLEQIIQNLVSNAIKYSPDGSPIEVTAGRDGAAVAIAVLDRGGGIAPDEMQRIFEPFFRSERTALKASGIGLGLSVCKRLVDAQGGRLWARTRPGGGTEIGFSLPLYALDDETDAVPPQLATA